MFKQERKKNVLPNVAGSNNSAVVRNKYGTGVRSYMVNSGLDNSKIGYDAKNNKVTYGGKAVLSPNVVVDGTSYANEDSLRNMVLDLHKSEGKNLVSAADYASAKTGIKNVAQIGDGYVSIGGNTVRANVSGDGVAYTDKDETDDAVKSYLKDINYKSEREIYDEWNREYGEEIRKAVASLADLDMSDFSLEDDAVYKAYSDMYRREGLRAYKDALGNGIAGTGGRVNSAALTAAGQGLNYYMQQLSDRVPEIAENAFERKLNARVKAVSELIKAGEDDFENRYKANSDYLKRLSDSNTENYDRRVEGEKSEYQKRLWDSELYGNYLDNEKELMYLDYLPRKYEAELSDEQLNMILKNIEIGYRPSLYSSEIRSNEQDALEKQIQLQYMPRVVWPGQEEPENNTELNKADELQSEYESILKDERSSILKKILQMK